MLLSVLSLIIKKLTKKLFDLVFIFFNGSYIILVCVFIWIISLPVSSLHVINFLLK